MVLFQRNNTNVLEEKKRVSYEKEKKEILKCISRKDWWRKKAAALLQAQLSGVTGSSGLFLGLSLVGQEPLM